MLLFQCENNSLKKAKTYFDSNRSSNFLGVHSSYREANISGNVTCSDVVFIDVAIVILEPLMLKRDLPISLWLGCTWISLVGLNRG